MRDCHYITSPIVYWGKGSTVSWYQVLRFFLLVTAYFDNSEFSRMVTVNSPSGVRFAQVVFPIRKQITYVKFNFCCIYLFGNLFVLPCLLYVIESN